jgi:small redox-active disulfide protein 2
MEIKVLGTGCSKCKSLENTIKKLVRELKVDAVVTKEEDIIKIMEYGVMRTPGLVINGKLAFSGRVPSPVELKELLTN